MLKTLSIAAAVALSALLSACGPAGGNLVVADFNNANFNGTWNNTTYGSNGASTASMVVDDMAQTVALTLDLNGGVFGMGDPPSEMFTGNYSSTGYALTGTSSFFGTLTINVTPAGVLSGSATGSAGGTRGNTALTGTVTATTISVSYSIPDSSAPGGGPITGTISLTKM
jgi:hypothetical protein